MLLRSTLKTSQYLTTDRIHAARNVILHEGADLQSVTCRADGRAFLLVKTADRVSRLDADALVVCGGLDPNTAALRASLLCDAEGFVLTGEGVGGSSPLMTSMPGVYAVGDCRAGGTKRIGAAIGDGSNVVTEVWRRFKKCPTCQECAF